MKKFILLLTLIFTTTVNSQYVILSAISLNDGAEADYLKLEEFFNPIHDAAIEAGIQNGQTLYKVTSESDSENIIKVGQIMIGCLLHKMFTKVKCQKDQCKEL